MAPRHVWESSLVAVVAVFATFPGPVGMQVACTRPSEFCDVPSPQVGSPAPPGPPMPPSARRKKDPGATQSVPLTPESSPGVRMRCPAGNSLCRDLVECLLGFKLRDGHEDKATILQDVENIFRDANVSTKHNKVDTLIEVAGLVVITGMNVTPVSTVTFKRLYDDDDEGDKSWSINTFLEESSDETITGGSNDVEVRLPPIITDGRLTAIVFPTNSNWFREMDPSNRLRLNSMVVNVNAYDVNKEPKDVPYIEIALSRHMYAQGCESDVCAFWSHNGTDRGRWLTDGCAKTDWRAGKVSCRCDHLTHFGALILETPLELGPAHQLALDVLTYLGCTMSLGGTGGIIHVAATSPGWRRDAGHKLVLCLAVNAALTTALFLPVAVGAVQSGPWCVAVGAGLHYTLLASFAWVLVSAWLQYRRYVLGIYTQLTHLVLKMSLLAWGLPAVPVAALLVVDLGLYTNYYRSCHPRTYCFPTGTSFYVTVVAPISVIVLVNVYIFFRIVRTITGGTKKVRPVRGGTSSGRVMFTIVMEFFLFGLPWAFGLLSSLSVFFLYLFCVTATQHGFVLFIFFVWFGKRDPGKRSGNTVDSTHQSELRGNSLSP